MGPRGEQGDFRTSLARVVAASGSVAGAARALDVPRRTLRRWLSGEGAPNAQRRAQVDAAALSLIRRARLTPDREKRLRRARTVTIVAVYRYDANNRPKTKPRTITFHIGRGGTDGMARDVVPRLVGGFLAGGSGMDPGSGLFDHLTDAMTDDWYREHFTADDEEGWDVDRVIIR